MARNYKGLEVWQLGYFLTLRLYKLTENFPGNEENNLTSQIRRASSSIPLNIAEGSSRFTKKAYLQFLQYAYGSIIELQVLLDLSKDLGYIGNNEYIELNEEVDKLSKKLFVFIKKVDKEKFYNLLKQVYLMEFQACLLKIVGQSVRKAERTQNRLMPRARFELASQP